MGARSFSGVRRPVRGVEQTSLSSVEVKERVELYLYSPSGISWPVIGWLYLYVRTTCVAQVVHQFTQCNWKLEKIFTSYFLFYFLFFNQRSCIFFHISYHLSFQDLNVGSVGLSTSNNQRATEFCCCCSTVCFDLESEHCCLYPQTWIYFAVIAPSVSSNWYSSMFQWRLENIIRVQRCKSCDLIVITYSFVEGNA